MLALISRLCQFAGLVCLPAALYIGMVKGDSRTELLLLVFGTAIFLIGRMMGRGGKGEAP
ncbi:MAG: hypothetical protein HYY93_13095 [Planctomycetes bacterium]|nr:hypothetical protein [Planctomycetota bacterium]